MNNNISSVIEYAKKSVTNTMINYPWWHYTQEEIRKSILFIIDNLPILGLQFKKSFIEMFQYEYLRRVVNHEAFPSDKPGILPGSTMSEESYHSGIAPTKYLLKLDDWIEPNDADVHACMSLCSHIETLEKIGLFDTVLATEDSKTTKIQSTKTKKTKKTT